MSSDLFKLVKLTSKYSSLFFDHIEENYAEFFFFHVDYVQYPNDTEIYMALDHEETIHGMMLIWKNRRIQLRGTPNAVEFLLAKKEYNPISITGFEEHRGLIESYFPKYTKETAMYRMGIKKHEFVDFEKYSVKLLTEDHKEELAAFMRSADPLYWGNRQAEDISIDKNNKFFSIKKDEELICITGLWIYEDVGYITIVGTHQNYRNQGYASSLVSSVLRYLFKEKDKSFITVRVDNPPAIHTYKKLGFKIFSTQFSCERERS